MATRKSPVMPRGTKPPTSRIMGSLLARCVFVIAIPVMAATTDSPTPDQLAFFEKKIRPVLSSKCYKCHSAESEKLKGGLLLDTREGARAGGDSGHAVVPGDVAGSLMIKAISYRDKELQMPPKEQLPAEVVADFEKWVKMGAPDPRDGKAPVAKRGIDLEKGRQHWAFQLPKKTVPPPVKNRSWAKTDIDKFVLAGMEPKGLKPVADADPQALVRRLYFDLIGLPPSAEAVETFVRACQSAPANRQSAIEKTVDQLLASPQFGEKWGRHWLDVARYAESSGKENNIIYPHAWRYRDYVIQAFNDDKPYNRFIKEQIAGDLLPYKNDTERANLEIATGYLAIGPKSHNTRDKSQFTMDMADEQIDSVTSGLMGMTVACARCHDHKFDPIPTRDYYALAGIFISTETRYGTPGFVQNNNPAPLIALPADAAVTDPEPMPPQQLAFLKQTLNQARSARDSVLNDPKEKSKGYIALVTDLKVIRSTIQIAIDEAMLDHMDENGHQRKLAMGVKDRFYGRDARILQRGEMDKPGPVAPRGFLQVINTEPAPVIEHGSGRLELADWIASPDNPLTARVMANRIWLHLFGHGIVPTPDNFGTTGQLPTNQALLDYLANRFVDNGWSIKKTIRDIVLSRTYQLSTTFDKQNYAIDPEDSSLWRMPVRRIEAEAIRDAMLQVSGKLRLAPPHGSTVAPLEGPAQILNRFGLKSIAEYERSVYLSIIRDQVVDNLAVFDFAEPSLVVGEREDTTVPTQALYLMNSPEVGRLAQSFARLLVEKSSVETERISLAYKMAFGRTPTPAELDATADFFKQFNGSEGRGKERHDLERMTAFCQALFASAEFRYLN